MAKQKTPKQVLDSLFAKLENELSKQKENRHQKTNDKTPKERR